MILHNDIVPCDDGELVETVSGLYKRWRYKTQTKRYTKEAYQFECYVAEQMNRLGKQIKEGKWKNKGYKHFMTHHPDREINAPSYPDRVVEGWLVENFIESYVCRDVIYENCSCQKGKGSELAWKLIGDIFKSAKAQDGEGRPKGFLLQIDMQGYFDNISHDYVKRLFAGLPEKPRNILYAIIDDWKCETGYAGKGHPEAEFGFPKGCLPSQWIGVYALSGLDKAIKGHGGCKSYVRYMDDIVIYTETKEQAHEIQDMAGEWLKENGAGVRLHPKKTRIRPVTEGITFCGWRYAYDKDYRIVRSIRKSTKNRMYERLKHLDKEYRAGRISRERCIKYRTCVIKYLEKGDSKKLVRYIRKRWRFRECDHACEKEEGKVTVCREMSPNVTDPVYRRQKERQDKMLESLQSFI